MGKVKKTKNAPDEAVASRAAQKIDESSDDNDEPSVELTSAKAQRIVKGKPVETDEKKEEDTEVIAEAFETAKKMSLIFKISILALICLLAFMVRVFSVIRFESVIHEFDPWFNYRITKFLSKEGWYALWNFFDSESWYPLGRVIGGTIFQFSLASWEVRFGNCRIDQVVTGRSFPAHGYQEYLRLLGTSLFWLHRDFDFPLHEGGDQQA